MALDAIKLASTISPIYCNDAAAIRNATNITGVLWQTNSSNGTIPSSCIPKATSPTQTVTDYSKSIVRIFYVAVLLVGTIGNVLACYIIITRKFMRRVIHIYTFNLAVADLIVILFFVPVEIVRNEHDLKWNMGDIMCSLSNIATPTSLGASVCTLVAITLDRHRGVTKPFSWRGDSRKILKLTIPAIWIVAIVSSAPLFFFAKVVGDHTGVYCVEIFPSKTFKNAYWIIIFILQVVLPFGIIVIANTHMICSMTKLSRQTHQVEQHKQHMKMIRMVVVLVLVYAICTSPQHIVYFWLVYGDLGKRVALGKALFKISNLLMIAQSAINPIIYGTWRNDFKRAFKSIFQCAKLRKSLAKSTNNNTMLVAKDMDPNPQASPEVNEISPALHAPPVRNLHLEKLREKHLKYNVSDTPPILRRGAYDSVTQTDGLIRKQRKDSNDKVTNKPNGNVRSSKFWRASKRQSKNGRINSFHFSRQFGSDEFKCLIDLPETIV